MTTYTVVKVLAATSLDIQWDGDYVRNKK